MVLRLGHVFLIPWKLKKKVIISLSLSPPPPPLFCPPTFHLGRMRNNLQLKPGMRSAFKVLPFREAAYLPPISMWKSVSFLCFVNTCLSHSTKSSWIELRVCKMNLKLKQAIDILCSHPRKLSFFCWQWSMTFKFCIPQQSFRKLKKELQCKWRKCNSIILN